MMSMEHPTFRRAPNGTLLLKASPQAQALGPRQVAGGQAAYRAKKAEEVDAEAWAHVASEGGDTTNATLVLSRWKTQFGRYQGKIFHWLLKNVVGYSVNLVSSHQKERERAGSQSPLLANKDAFTRYSLAYPEFAEAVRFHRAFEEARVKSLQHGQEGQALVGFGDHKFETLQSLYESEDSKKIRFVNSLRRKAPTPGMQMETAVQYIRSQRAKSASQILGSALADFVSGRRSLSTWKCRPVLERWWSLGLHFQPPTSAPSGQLCPPPGLRSLRMQSW
ncbi:uncharacterized protein [Cebidichthys violaceus]|uniref:uncharacterized protein isoform X2 n=1 Tax=Cebidichthys violaceus TaxID=271503 RepID=UPI0035CC7ADF